MDIKCKLLNLSVHTKHLGSLHKMQISKHLSKEFHSLHQGWSPRIYTLCVPKAGNTQAKVEKQ